MAPRRLLALLTVVGLAIAMLVLPAAAQTAPAISLTPSEDAAGQSGTWSIGVRGSGFPASYTVFISFAGEVVGQATATNGSFSTTITPNRRTAGAYEVVATQQACPPTRYCPPNRASAMFRAVPQSSHNNPCGAVGTRVNITITGTNFPQESYGYIDYDPNGPDRQQEGRIPTGSGTFSRTFTVTVPNRAISISVYDVDQNSAPPLTWRPAPCSAAPTTTTSTSTTSPPVKDPGPGPDPTPGPTTTTARPGPGDPPPTAPPTLPPTVELPPPTPGATITVTPDIGPPGFVTGVTGTGFPPGPVTLVWAPGIGTTTTVAGPDGTISARVLIFPGDRLGPRALVATAGATSAFDAFLVVPSTVQPSGQEVGQINRIRRFNNR